MQLAFILAVAASCVVIYWLLIRPKLHAIEALDPYFDEADARYARWWEKLRGWRVEAAAFLGIFLLELPDIIDFLTGANLVSYLPAQYQQPAQIALMLLALLRAILTKRAAEKKLDEAEK